jgi:molybdopterin-containing oxidoreductase family membrane subunit
MESSHKIWWFLFSLLALVTFVFMYIRIEDGLSFTNLNNIVGWGLWVTFYVFFLGISVGLFLLYGIYQIFQLHKFRVVAVIALYSSFVSLLIGLFFIVIDIGHLGRFWTVFINRNLSSVLSWELHLYVLYIALISSLLFLEMFLPEQQKYTESNRLIWLIKNKNQVIMYLTYIGIPLAIAVHGGTGALFAVIKARAFWNSAIFPVIFLTSAILSGIATITFLIGCFRNMIPIEKYIKPLSLIFLLRL